MAPSEVGSTSTPLYIQYIPQQKPQKWVLWYPHCRGLFYRTKTPPRELVLDSPITMKFMSDTITVSSWLKSGSIGCDGVIIYIIWLRISQSGMSIMVIFRHMIVNMWKTWWTLPQMQRWCRPGRQIGIFLSIKARQDWIPVLISLIIVKLVSRNTCLN